MPSPMRVSSRAARRARGAVVALLAVALAVVLGAVVGAHALDASSSTAVRLVPEHAGAGPLVPDGVTVDDGVVPGGGTGLDSGLPAVVNLDAALLTALRRAADAAADDGVAFTVTSGWRSAEYQEQLLQEAVTEHGSAEEAARWVATPDTSAHVSGGAVDLGPAAARSWLSEQGAAHGLCQTYRNEPWHYELRPAAVEDGCPGMFADAAHDPRMQP